MAKPGEIIELTEGSGRTRISLGCRFMGGDTIVFIFNEQAHIGAVAVADYDHKEKRASTSVITRLGHKDDTIAQSVAHDICKHTLKPVCVIAGIHLDNITESEIKELIINSATLVKRFIDKITEEKR